MKLKSRSGRGPGSVVVQIGSVIIDMPAGTGEPHPFSSPDESRIPTRIPSIQGLDLAAGAMLAAPFEPVLPGGEFLDVFKLKGGFGLALGAVAGRGHETVALAKVAKYTLRAEAFRNSASDGLASSVDSTIFNAGAALFQSLRRESSLSLLYGHYEPEWRCLTFCNCSPWPPALIRHGRVSFLEERHPRLGEHLHREYPPTRLTLSPGDVFVAYTDGLPEARQARSFLGLDPIRRVLQEHAGESAVKLAQHLLGLPRSFCGDASPAEDALVLVARLKEGNGRQNWDGSRNPIEPARS